MLDSTEIEMVKAKIFCGVVGFAFLLMISMASAVETDIVVKTISENQVTVRIFDMETVNALETFVRTADEDGEISITYAGDSPFIRLSTFIRGDPLLWFKKDSNGKNISALSEIHIDLTSGSPKAIVKEKLPVVNETTENETIEEVVEDLNKTEEEVTGGGAGITGSAIFSGKTTTSKVFYSVLGVIILGAIVFFFMKRGHFSSGGGEEREPRVTKLSEMTKQSEGKRLDGAEKRLEKAERELRDARNEISTIKNKKSELTEAEEQFKKAKENLEKLEGKED